MLITEQALLDALQSARRVFLLEPAYRRKYVLLGLAKLSSYLKQHHGQVEYGRHYTGQDVDLVCITSLFTYDSAAVHRAIEECLFYGQVPIVGGVYVSLMHSHLERLFPQVRFFEGYAKELDLCTPDYSLEYGIQPPFDNYGYVFTERGCPNACAYCAVPRIEAERWIVPNWRDHIVHKPWLMVYDNNPGYFREHTLQVLEAIRQHNKAVEFNNGFDCKHLDSELARALGKIRFARRGMRMSFDRIAEDGLFQSKVNLLIEHGVRRNDFFVYVLFNFQDTPREADYRAHECVRLGIEPYPTMYIPLHYLDRHKDFVGKHWTPRLVKAFRRFYLLAGYYKRQRFGDFIHTEACKPVLNEEDFVAWEKN